MTRERSPSLLASVLGAAVARIETGAPLDIIDDKTLIRVMKMVATEIVRLPSVDFERTNTIEKLLTEAIRLGCYHGTTWWTGSDHTYSQVTTDTMLAARIVEDHLPEFLTRFHSLPRKR